VETVIEGRTGVFFDEQTVASLAAAIGQFECAESSFSEADARVTALAKVPDGTIKEAELEKEKGKLIWSFDIARPGTKDITEVNVNAVTGEIVAVDVEAAKDQAKEKDEDERKEKKDKD